VSAIAVGPDTARRTFRALEPVHGMIYFTPHARAAYADLGITQRRAGYFASRSAAMGTVPAEVVVATFFNFNPALVHAALPAAWKITSPADVLAARRRAVDLSLRQAWDDGIGGAEVIEAAGLARSAAERACERPQGRPLFAGHASLPWPDEPHLVLWHAQTLLREYRGDGHVGLLLTEGLDGLGALISHSATGIIAAEALRVSRGWSEAEWAAGVERLRDLGWLTDGPDPVLTEDGRRRRQSIEDRTDKLSTFPYEAIGEGGCARLRELARPLATAITTAGLDYPTELATRYAEPD
jgi:hypothetical protein